MVQLFVKIQVFILKQQVITTQLVTQDPQRLYARQLVKTLVVSTHCMLNLGLVKLSRTNGFLGFSEGDGSFILNKDGYLEFKITQSSSDAQILFYIKKQLGFGSVSVQDKINKTHHFRVRDKKNILKLINS